MSQLTTSIFAHPRRPEERASAGQLRAARALLGWSLLEAARACRVSVSALARAERGGADLRDDVVAAIQDGYGQAGIRFASDSVSLAR